MATEVVEHDVHKDQEDAWSGGKSPFHASYGKLMMWYFLLSDAFTFAGFLIAYGALRFSSPTWPVPDFVFQTAPFGIEGMPLIFVTFMSFLLIISSVTMVRGVQEGHRENKRGVAKWMLLTVIGGIGFLSCQAWEWQNLIGTEGMTVTVNPFSTHLEDGTYLSEEQLVAKGYVKTTKVLVKDAAPATYFLHPKNADIADNRMFVKRDHHQIEAGNHHGHDAHGASHDDGHKANMAGEKVAKDGSYLIAYNHHTKTYERGAIDNGGDIRNESFGPKAFGALFFFITGFHGFHVFSGVLFLVIIMVNVMSGLYEERKNGYEMVEKIGLYWHFVDLVWVFVFLAFYLL